MFSSQLDWAVKQLWMMSRADVLHLLFNIYNNYPNTFQVEVGTDLLLYYKPNEIRLCVDNQVVLVISAFCLNILDAEMNAFIHIDPTGLLRQLKVYHVQRSESD